VTSVRRVITLLLLLLAAARPAPAQTSPRPASEGTAPLAVGAEEPGGELVVTLITFGLGQQVFERFGHNAIWVHDTALGTDVAYDWGNFDFAQPAFLRRFLTGDTRYAMEAREATSMIEAYRLIGRPITLQRLNLTATQARSLRDFLRWNALEENKYYRYDYYLDNCSTRLRDALDEALGGALRGAVGSAPTALSYRRESVRLTDGDKPVQAGIDLALGRPADAPLTRWESFFIPMRLRDAIRDVRVPGGESGALVPLVADERFVPPAPGTTVIAERAASPRLAVRFAAVGLVLAAIVVALRFMAVSRRGVAWALAVFGAGWFLLCGAIGTIIVLAWTATRHQFWSWNENLLQVSPIALVLVVLVPLALLRGSHATLARRVAGLVVAFGVIGALLALLPGGQESRAIVALFLPVHLALAWALWLPRATVKPARAVPQA
jgi:hypothetical protein